MGDTVHIRNLTIGEGQPKICVPIVGKTQEEIQNQTKRAMEERPDLLEWRVDFYEAMNDKEKVQDRLHEIRDIAGDIPLMYTVRTKRDGGNAAFTVDEYLQHNMTAVTLQEIDLLDVETAHGDDIAYMLIELAHQNGKKVIASYHNFSMTPKKEEIIMRLCKMQELDADIAKIAVMPKEYRDVLTLLDATLSMKELHAVTPVVTMAMGEKGAVSRVSGAVFGSAITFGTAAKASAPGQIPASELKKILPYFMSNEN